MAFYNSAPRPFAKAANDLALPSAVRGPVLKPPWLRQRPFVSAFAWHGVPLRVLAPHLILFLIVVPHDARTRVCVVVKFVPDCAAVY